MKIPLKPFQEKAVRRLVKKVDDAYGNWSEDSDRTAVLLVAPTGAGKTMVATAVIEALLNGFEQIVERPALRVLWLTDSPSLNRQSVDKMDRYGDFLTHDKNLVVVDDSYDAEVLTPGTVTFVHIQQLTSSATSWWPNEAKGKKYALWDAMARTIREFPESFLLVIDEAHKSIGAGKRGDERDTIIKTVLDGGLNFYDQAVQPATPVALVMTATPQRFREAMISGSRRIEEEKVPVADVQNAGLLKKQVSVEFTAEEQKAHHTLLEAGTEDLHQSEEWWAQAHADGFAEVIPVLVVQVENSVSKAELVQRATTVADKWASLSGTALPDRAFAHAFGEDGDVKTEAMTIRKIPAELIDSDTFVRVVFFKEALTTGWDCPRAEVMVSLRPASDATTIAQLVGRMIRTPGAVEAPDPRLDSVILYLPHYDRAEVQRVVKEVSKDTDGVAEIILNSVTVTSNPTVEAKVFALLNSLPKYTKPRQDFSSDVERAEALAELLIDRGVVTISEDDLTPAENLRDLLITEATRLYGANKKTVDARAKDLMDLDTQRGQFSYATEDTPGADAATALTRIVNVRDLDGYFEAAKRKLPGGSSAWFFEYLVAEGLAGKKAKMRVVAVSELPDAKASLNQVAAKQITQMREDYEDRIATLGLLEQFKAVWYPPDQPVDGTLTLVPGARAATQKARKKGNGIEIKHLPLLERHVWAFEAADGTWRYPGSDNGWEAAALDLELDTSRKVVGWYRNPGSGRAALSIPFYANKKLELLHPDFIFVREIEGSLVVDIVDPAPGLW